MGNGNVVEKEAQRTLSWCSFPVTATMYTGYLRQPAPDNTAKATLADFRDPVFWQAVLGHYKDNT